MSLAYSACSLKAITNPKIRLSYAHTTEKETFISKKSDISVDIHTVICHLIYNSLQFIQNLTIMK